MPDYTKGEEIFNMVTHIVGGALGIVYLVICVVVAAIHKNVYGVVSSAIYGACVIILFTISSVYHGLHQNMGKRVLQVLDHCTIYLMIAGTYTPVTLSALRTISPVKAWVTFGIVWGIAVCMIVFTAIDLNKFKILSMIAYLGMGWCIIASVKSVIKALTPFGFGLLLAGGILYTIGVVFYVSGKKRRYAHSVFHIFVDLGSLSMVRERLAPDEGETHGFDTPVRHGPKGGITTAYHRDRGDDLEIDSIIVDTPVVLKNAETLFLNILKEENITYCYLYNVADKLWYAADTVRDNRFFVLDENFINAHS